MLKRVYIILTAIMCLCILLADPALSADEVREITVARGGDGFYPPFDMVIEKKLTGFHIDLINAVAQKLQIKVSFKEFPWQRAVAMLKNGDLDAITFMSKNKEREQFGYFFEGNILSLHQDGFFVPKERAQKIEFSGDLKHLQSYTIGVINGYSYGQTFDNATYLYKDDGAKTEEQLIRKLLGGRFDIGIAGVARTSYIAKQIGIENIEFIKPYLPGLPQYIVFSKKKNLEQLAKQFAKAAKSFKKTTAYRELERKYGLAEE